MAVSPCSYDFFTFLYSAQICKKRRGLETIKLIFVHGTKNNFRDDNLRTDEQNKTFFENVIIPGISLLKDCDSFMWIKRSDINLENVDPTNIFPRGYSPVKPVSEYLPGELIAAQIRNDKPSLLRAPDYALKLAQDYLSITSKGKPVITLTTRELERENNNRTRNIKKSEWHAALKDISKDFTPIVIRDTGKSHDNQLFEGIAECPQAAVHLPFRMALYSSAYLNFTKNAGPSLLLLYGECNTIFLSEYDNDVTALSEDWFKNHFGMDGNSQYPMTTVSKKFVWGKEDRKNIVNFCYENNQKEISSTELNRFSSSENVKASIIAAVRHLIKVMQYNLMLEDVKLYREIEKLNQNYRVFSNLQEDLLKIEKENLPQGTISTLIKEASKYE